MQIVPYANLHAEYLECQTAVDTAIARCLRNSSFIQGPEVVNFEHIWASYNNSPACAGVSSGTYIYSRSS
jgi:dTDP-4-amino-4,6-dideoxygalactose transaminase